MWGRASVDVARTLRSAAGEAKTTEERVTLMFRRCLVRPPTDDEVQYWVDYLNTSGKPEQTKGAMVLQMLSDVHTWFEPITDPLDPNYAYHFVADLLNNKAAVAHYYAVEQGLSMNVQADNIGFGLKCKGMGEAERAPIVRRYIDGKPLPELRMAYARALLDGQRYAEATQQLQVVTAEKPDYPEGWLVQGTLLLQDNKDAAAEASLKRYIELVQAQRSGEERSRGLAQAYMSLSRIAEKRKDFAMAGAWLDRIDNPQDLIAAQSRRASILARQARRPCTPSS